MASEAPPKRELRPRRAKAPQKDVAEKEKKEEEKEEVKSVPKKQTKHAKKDEKKEEAAAAAAAPDDDDEEQKKKKKKQSKKEESEGEEEARPKPRSKKTKQKKRKATSGDPSDDDDDEPEDAAADEARPVAIPDKGGERPEDCDAFWADGDTTSVDDPTDSPMDYAVPAVAPGQIKIISFNVAGFNCVLGFPFLFFVVVADQKKTDDE